MAPRFRHREPDAARPRRGLILARSAAGGERPFPFGRSQRRAVFSSFLIVVAAAAHVAAGPSQTASKQPPPGHARMRSRVPSAPRGRVRPVTGCGSRGAARLGGDLLRVGQLRGVRALARQAEGGAAARASAARLVAVPHGSHAGSGEGLRSGVADRSRKPRSHQRSRLRLVPHRARGASGNTVPAHSSAQSGARGEHPRPGRRALYVAAFQEGLPIFDVCCASIPDGTEHHVVKSFDACFLRCKPRAHAGRMVARTWAFAASGDRRHGPRNLRWVLAVDAFHPGARLGLGSLGPSFGREVEARRCLESFAREPAVPRARSARTLALGCRSQPRSQRAVQVRSLRARRSAGLELSASWTRRKRRRHERHLVAILAVTAWCTALLQGRGSHRRRRRHRLPDAERDRWIQEGATGRWSKPIRRGAPGVRKGRRRASNTRRPRQARRRNEARTTAR